MLLTTNLKSTDHMSDRPRRKHRISIQVNESFIADLIMELELVNYKINWQWFDPVFGLDPNLSPLDTDN